MIAEEAKTKNVLELDPSAFSQDEIRIIHENIHDSQSLLEVMSHFTYEKLQHLMDDLMTSASRYYQDVLKVPQAEKHLKGKLENLLDYKDRVGCSEPIEGCLHEGCFRLSANCAVRKTKEDILAIAQIFESRRNRSTIPHVAVELFFKKLIEDHNCIGVILSDKLGSPKIFTTDGSAISTVITSGIHRLAEAIRDHEFRFSGTSEPFLVFNQHFPIDDGLASKLQPFEKNPDLKKYVKRLTFSSIGIEIVHEKIILSIIYLGDNMLRQFLLKAILGIERIRVETDPDARLRAAFGR